MLAVLINQAKEDGQISVVAPHLIGDGLSIFHYTYDTLFFTYHDLEKAKKLKLLFSVFEKLFGLKDNFH